MKLPAVFLLLALLPMEPIRANDGISFEVIFNVGQIKIDSLPGSASLEKSLWPDDRSIAYGLESVAFLNDRVGISLGIKRASDFHWSEVPACPAEGPCEITHVYRHPLEAKETSAGVVFYALRHHQFVVFTTVKQVRNMLEFRLSDTDSSDVRHKGVELGLGVKWQTESGWFVGAEWASADLKSAGHKHRQTGFEAQIGFRF